MHAKSANFGKICFLCILKGVKNAVREYISRISCPEGPLFPSGALKSCTMGKFCHSFVIPPSARRGGWRTTSVVILGYRSVAVPFTWRRKRCESQPQVQAHGAHPETQAHGRVLPVGKPCINPQARAPWGPPGCKLMGPTRRRKHHGTQPEVQALRSPFMGCKRCGSFFVRECQSGNESYRAGKAITNTAPPSGALNAVTVPSKLSTISFTMAKPRPAPPLLRAREASLR